jgi:MauM/NapG family ferredoxin protein
VPAPEAAAPVLRGGRRVHLPRAFRRAYQAYFLLFFLATLALMTDEGVRRFPVRLLFESDPLAAAGLLASSYMLPAGLVVALATVALTLVFGRAFCGWICPLGTLHHLVSWATRRLRRGPFETVNRWRPHFRLKYLLLIALLIVALFGGLLAGLLDPLSLLARSFGSSLLPAWRWALGTTGPRPRLFAGAWLTGGVFLGLLAADRWIARWWCRALCPLGALLGLVSRAAVFRIRLDRAVCTECRLCLRDCQGADEPFGQHRVSECHVCLNCVAACPEGAIGLRAFAPAAAPSGGVVLPRRQLVGAALGGVALLPLLRASGPVSADPRAIRPPGALAEEAFLARCVRCGACQNACPTSALQPAFGEAGFEGLWTPVLVARRGWCEPSCVRCGQVCPTGAIRALGPDEKGWTREGPAIRIGTAFFDQGRCLPWAMATPCIVCEEVCPTSPKAIWLEPAETVRRDGTRVTLKRPRMDPSRCVGCGLCEAKCPVNDLAAVRVTRAGESREQAAAFTLGGRT